MFKKFLFIITAIVAAPSLGLAAESKLQGPVVLELFTSQSCSSCPPADHFLGELKKDPEVIALGYHVTYWDHLSWKDTLSHDFCTERQHDYAASNQSSRVYTPELRINGKASVVGSQRARVLQGIAKENGKIIPLQVKHTNNGFEIQLPEMTQSNLSVTLVSYSDDLVQKITSGENRNNTVTYHNPVNGIRPLSSKWDGHARSISFKNSDLPTNSKGFALLVQQNTYKGVGPILAAGKIELTK